MLRTYVALSNKSRSSDESLATPDLILPFRYKPLTSLRVEGACLVSYQLTELFVKRNIHYCNAWQTSVFVPAFGSSTKVRVSSQNNAHDVMVKLLNKFRVENSPEDFSFYIVKGTDGEWCSVVNGGILGMN